MDLSFYKGKRVLVTGASGYIGSMLAFKLARADCRLLLHSHRSKVHIKNSKAVVKEITGDISQQNAWENLVSDVDIIFHLAEHHYNTFNPLQDLAITAQPMLSLLETLRKHNKRPQIVFASSSNLVGHVSMLPVDENFPDNPLTIYAIHKKLAEQYLNYYNREYRIPSITLRLANVYGPSVDPEVSKKAVLNFIIDSVLTSGRAKLFSNKDKIRDFVFIDDVVEAFLAAGSIPGNGKYYIIGSGERQTFKNIVDKLSEKVNRTTGKTVDVLIDDEARISEVEKRDFVADISAFKNLTGWIPKVLADKGMVKTIDYFVKNAGTI